MSINIYISATLQEVTQYPKTMNKHYTSIYQKCTLQNFQNFLKCKFNNSQHMGYYCNTYKKLIFFTIYNYRCYLLVHKDQNGCKKSGRQASKYPVPSISEWIHNPTTTLQSWLKNNNGNLGTKEQQKQGKAIKKALIIFTKSAKSLPPKNILQTALRPKQCLKSIHTSNGLNLS